MRAIWSFFLSVALLSATPLAAHDTHRQITVVGEAQVAAQPDIAHVTLGVMQRADTAGDAMTQTSTAMAAVLESLAAAGLASEDVQTQTVQLDTLYRYTDQDGVRQSEIMGFQATNTVRITVRALDTLGEVLDQVISAGATEVHGISFAIADAEALLDDARIAAIEAARAKAERMAAAAGARLGPVVSVTESGPGAGPDMQVMMSASRERAVPIAPGQISISAQITMVYALRS